MPLSIDSLEFQPSVFRFIERGDGNLQSHLRDECEQFAPAWHPLQASVRQPQYARARFCLEFYDDDSIAVRRPASWRPCRAHANQVIA